MHLSESSARALSISSLSDFFSLFFPFFPDGLECTLAVDGAGDKGRPEIGPEIFSASAFDAAFFFFFLDCVRNIKIYDRQLLGKSADLLSFRRTRWTLICTFRIVPIIRSCVELDGVKDQYVNKRVELTAANPAPALGMMAASSSLEISSSGTA
jgi:hypothetical protein